MDGNGCVVGDLVALDPEHLAAQAAMKVEFDIAGTLG